MYLNIYDPPGLDFGAIASEDNDQPGRLKRKFDEQKDKRAFVHAADAVLYLLSPTFVFRNTLLNIRIQQAASKLLKWYRELGVRDEAVQVDNLGNKKPEERLQWLRSNTVIAIPPTIDEIINSPLASLWAPANALFEQPDIVTRADFISARKSEEAWGILCSKQLEQAQLPAYKLTDREFWAVLESGKESELIQFITKKYHSVSNENIEQLGVTLRQINDEKSTNMLSQRSVGIVISHADELPPFDNGKPQPYVLIPAELDRFKFVKNERKIQKAQELLKDKLIAYWAERNKEWCPYIEELFSEEIRRELWTPLMKSSGDYQVFFVSSVGEVEINESGARNPVFPVEPIAITAPLIWVSDYFFTVDAWKKTKVSGFWLNMFLAILTSCLFFLMVYPSISKAGEFSGGELPSESLICKANSFGLYWEECARKHVNWAKARYYDRLGGKYTIEEVKDTNTYRELNEGFCNKENHSESIINQLIAFKEKLPKAKNIAEDEAPELRSFAAEKINEYIKQTENICKYIDFQRDLFDLKKEILVGMLESNSVKKNLDVIKEKVDKWTMRKEECYWDDFSSSEGLEGLADENVYDNIVRKKRMSVACKNINKFKSEFDSISFDFSCDEFPVNKLWKVVIIGFDANKRRVCAINSDRGRSIELNDVLNNDYRFSLYLADSSLYYCSVATDGQIKKINDIDIFSDISAFGKIGCSGTLSNFIHKMIVISDKINNPFEAVN